MIRYRLNCPEGHEFEGWFASSAAYDKQVKAKLVTCPACGSPKVSKALMAPSVVTSEKAAAARTEQAPAQAPGEAAPPAPQRMFSAEQRELLRKMRQLRDEVLAQSEYVGPRFAEEARRIHTAPEKEKAKPRRGIYGEASPSEVKSLAEDGIEVYPVPVLPEDAN